METINEKILKTIQQVYPFGVFDYETKDMGTYETRNEGPLYYFSNTDFWKKERISFLRYNKNNDILYIPKQEYEEYQKEVLLVLEKENQKVVDERNIESLTEQLTRLAIQFGFNKRQILEYCGHNERVGDLIFKNCQGMYPFTYYAILDDAHQIGEYDGMVFETHGERPEEYIYQKMFLKHYPNVSFVDFLIGPYNNEVYIKDLIQEHESQRGEYMIEKSMESKQLEQNQMPTGECYRYYSVRRPIQIGGVPKKNMLRTFNFEEAQKLPNFSRKVWGYVEYSQPLQATEKENCELYTNDELVLYQNNVSLEENIMENFAMRLDCEEFEQHMEQVVDTMSALESFLFQYEEKRCPLFVVGSVIIDNVNSNTGADCICTLDHFYKSMQNQAYKNGMDLMFDTHSTALIYYGYGNVYTRNIEGEEFSGVDVERYELNFLSSDDLPKSVRDKCWKLLENDGFETLNSNEYKLLTRYNSLNEDIIAQLLSDDPHRELADSYTQTQAKEK